MTKPNKKLRERRGEIMLLAMVLMTGMLVVFTGVMEYTRLLIVSTGIRDAMSNAVTSVAISNAYNSYNGVREGNSGAYQLTGEEDWREQISTIDVQNKLVTLLHLQSKNGVFISPNPEGTTYEFKISEIDVQPDNAEFASNEKKAKYSASCRVEVPLSFGLELFPPMVTTMRHQAIYVALFE